MLNLESYVLTKEQSLLSTYKIKVETIDKKGDSAFIFEVKTTEAGVHELIAKLFKEGLITKGSYPWLVIPPSQITLIIIEVDSRAPIEFEIPNI